ncbi:MAG: hypothetical protein WC653_00615 [Candidatus Gracilibacteria bacterium]
MKLSDYAALPLALTLSACIPTPNTVLTDDLFNDIHVPGFCPEGKHGHHIAGIRRFEGLSTVGECKDTNGDKAVDFVRVTWSEEVEGVLKEKSICYTPAGEEEGC